MPYLVAIVLAVLIVVVTRLAGLDRDRALYPVALIVIGSYYVLFAAMGGSTPSIVTETIGAIAFLVIAVIGFRINLWIVARGINIGLHTRLYFSDEEKANTEDPILARIEHKVRVPTLIAERQGDAYIFDVHLQGEKETVFFDS